MPQSSPPSYGSTAHSPPSHTSSPPSIPAPQRPPAISHPSGSSTSSLASKVLAVRAAHRLTSGSGIEDDSALSPTSIDVHPRPTHIPTPNPNTSHGPGPGPFRDPFPSPIRFMDDLPHPHCRGSGHSTPGSDVTPRPGASIRFRPPRKSIDAGRLARQRSYASRAPSSSIGGESGLGAGSDHPSSPSVGDRRRSSAMGGKPRYRWLSQPGGGTGDEPGVDVRSRRDEEAYGGLKGSTTVTVVDYANYVPPQEGGGGAGGGARGQQGSVDSYAGGWGGNGGEEEEEDMNFRVEFPGERLGEWLDGEGKRKLGRDGKGVGVRWIHVQGLNWEVIKTLTLHYNLHPLAVEDALRSSNSPRSKLDFYRSHLYLQLLIHHIHHEDEAAIEAALEGGVFEEDDGGDHGHGRSSYPYSGGGGGGGEAELGAAGSAVDGIHGGAGGFGSGVGGGGGGGRGGGPKRKGTIERLKEALGSRGEGEGGGVGEGRGGRAGAGQQGVVGVGGSGLRLPDGVEGVFEPSVGGTKLQGGESPYQKEAHRLTVDQLSAKYMVPIRRGIMSVFMTRDGTIITLSQKRFREVVNPIYERLEDDQSLLRRSADASMLAQAFLDIAADLAVEVTQTFEAEILNLEASVLVDPQIDTVRHLHVLSSQLIRLRRSITPLLHITCNIRDQDVQRSAAASAIPVKGKDRGGSLASIAGSGPNGSGNGNGHGNGHGGSAMSTATNSLASLSIPELVVPASSGNSGARGGLGVPGWATPREEPGSNRSYMPSSSAGKPQGQGQGTTADSVAGGSIANAITGGGNGQGGQAIGGYFSPLAKVYMGDVIDHLEMVVSSMDQFVATCDHLTDYIFNVLSFQTNESMERLSIVTVIFLPLTFISSFFGMNFIDFPEINQSVNYFWKVAAPSTFLFFIIFSFSYIRTFFETGWRRTQRWRSQKAVEGRFRRGVGGGMGIKGE